MLTLVVSGAEAERPFDLKKFLAPTDLQRFDGQVKAVDVSARTVTIGMPMRFTFRVRNETKITLRGRVIPFDAIKVGDGIDVVGRHGADGKWTALTISLQKGRTYLHSEEISARTVEGKTITGVAVIPLIAYTPPEPKVSHNVEPHDRAGLFLLVIRPDGTVADVRAIKEFGVSELDGRAIPWLKKWKFRPASLTDVRVPVNFNIFRPGWQPVR